MSSLSSFPRTTVGGINLPRLIIGSNWLLGYSHTSLAKDRFIKGYQTRRRIAAILKVFLGAGVDAVMGPPSGFLEEALQEAEQRAGCKLIRIITPWMNVSPGGPPELEPE